MKPFMNGEFLLTNETGSLLFHKYAQDCPIIDYHNHLSPQDIYERRRYENLTQLWLERDHYKWRCMRACGVPEELITGAAPDWDKFLAFAQIMPRLAGNPVYHWVHLELQRYFGITTPLHASTAKLIWEQTCAMLAGSGFDAVSLLNRMKVKILCTTDDPADSLSWHLALAEDRSIPFRTLPSFRPDRFLHIDQPAFAAAVEQLGDRYGTVTDWDSLLQALSHALDHFCAAGCKVTDHGFIRFRYAEGDPAPVVRKALAGTALTEMVCSMAPMAFAQDAAAETESGTETDAPRTSFLMATETGEEIVTLAEDGTATMSCGLGDFYGTWWYDADDGTYHVSLDTRMGMDEYILEQDGDDWGFTGRLWVANVHITEAWPQSHAGSRSNLLP